MGNLVFGSAERPGNSTSAAEIPVVRDNDVAIGQGARPTERPEKATAAARHNGAQRGAAAEETGRGDRAESLPKHDGSANVLVPETPDKAMQLSKPLFGVVPETPEKTSLFDSPDSAYMSRPMDPDHAELKTPALTEYLTPPEVTNIPKGKNAEWTPAPRGKEHRSISIFRSSPEARRHSRKGQETDRTSERSRSLGTPKEPRKRLQWAEIEDVLAPTKIEGSSSDTESESIHGKPNSRRASSTRKPKMLPRVESFSSSSSDDETCIRSKPKHILKPPKFDGTGSFETFLAQFRNCAVYNKWTEAEKLVYLRGSLDKEAGQVLWDYGAETTNSFK